MTHDAAPATSTAGRRRTPAAILWVGLIAGLSAILIGLLALFILPSLSGGPRDLAVGVVASEEELTAIETQLETGWPEGFDVEAFSTSAALDAAVESRQVAGGFDLSDGTVRTVVASAGSTAISGTFTTIGQAIAGGFGTTAVVDDIVPLPAGDPTGIGIGGLAFPLVFGGIVPAAAFRALFAGRRPWILAGLIGFSAVGGLIVAWMLRFAFGSIEHSFWPVAGAVALGIAALAIPLGALNEAFGAKGFTIVAALMMFVGNPFAGIGTTAAWLPAGVATIGQLLPPGADGTLVRAVAYFGGAGGGAAFATLAVWVVTGLALWCAAPAIQRRREARAAVKAANAGRAAEPTTAELPQVS